MVPRRGGRPPLAIQTREELAFVPSVDICKSGTGNSPAADMPVVATADIVVDLQNDVLAIVLDVKPCEPANGKDISVEF
jgi:HSP20 family molecular chaperone IbpA